MGDVEIGPSSFQKEEENLEFGGGGHNVGLDGQTPSGPNGAIADEDKSVEEEKEEQMRCFRKQMEKERRKLIRGQRVVMKPITCWDGKQCEPATRLDQTSNLNCASGEIDETSILERKEIIKAFWKSKMDENNISDNNGKEQEKAVRRDYNRRSDEPTQQYGGGGLLTDIVVRLNDQNDVENSEEKQLPGTLEGSMEGNEIMTSAVYPVTELATDEDVTALYLAVSESPIEKAILHLVEKEKKLKRNKEMTSSMDNESRIEETEEMKSNRIEENRIEQEHATELELHSPEPTDSWSADGCERRLATLRIRREIEEHIRREKDLRALGSIATTSEEHVDSQVISHLRLLNGNNENIRDATTELVEQPTVTSSFRSSTVSYGGGANTRTFWTLQRAVSRNGQDNNPVPTKGVMARFIASRGKISPFHLSKGTVSNSPREHAPIIEPPIVCNENAPLKPRRDLECFQTARFEREFSNRSTPRRSHSSTVESRILDELKEMKDREAELRMLRSELIKTDESLATWETQTETEREDEDLHQSQPDLNTATDTDMAGIIVTAIPLEL